MPELNLSLGRRYIRRDGRKTGPLVLTETVYPLVADQYPFYDPEDDVTYKPNGALLSEGPGQERTQDLIREFISEQDLPALTTSDICVLWS